MYRKVVTKKYFKKVKFSDLLYQVLITPIFSSYPIISLRIKLLTQTVLILKVLIHS